MSLWSRQGKEIQAALIAGVFTLGAAGVGLISDRSSSTGPPPAVDMSPSIDPAYCLELLDRLDKFLDRDPRNSRIFMRTGPDGEPVVAFGQAARSCGIHDPAVLRELTTAGN